MREIRSPLDGILSPFATERDAYSAAGLSPLLVADFTKPYFRKAGNTSTFSDTFTHSRLGNATMVDSDGLIKWAPHNLALNSAAPVTQSITVVSGADYTVEITGSGSVALTGAGTGTVTAGNPVEITASTTTLTLTVTGTPSTMWAYRSDLGGMVNNPDTGTSYVPTTAAAVHQARRNHHTYNGTSWVNSGLLLETEARTNVFIQSEDFTTTTGAWSNINVDTSTTSQGPDGLSTSATKMLEVATTSEHQVNEAVSMSALTYYTHSVFAKSIGGRDCTLFFFTNSINTILQASFDLATGELIAGSLVASGSSPPTDISAKIEDVGDGWYRVSLSGKTTATAGAGSARIHASTGATFSYAGDITKGIEIYGAQFEAGSTPSSYMPTAGATFTRPAESLQIAAADMPWDASNVSLQMNGKITYADEGAEAQQTFARWYDDANNYIIIDLDTDSTDTGEMNFEQKDGTGGTGTVTADTYSPGILVPYNIASRNTSTAINGATDGTAGTEDTTPTALPDLSAKDFSLGYDYMGTISQFRAWNKDIGDAGIAEASS